TDEVVAGPFHTPDYPTPICLPGQITQTSARAQITAVVGMFNRLACDADTIIWEWGTTPGGPYPNTVPSADVAALSPSTDLTGLAPSTTYYYRARLAETVDTNGEYLVTPECSFTTLEDEPVTDIPPTFE